MTTHLTVCFGKDRSGEPPGCDQGLPGFGTNLAPEQAEHLSRQLKQIANDARRGIGGIRHYPEDEPCNLI